jgi:hypothetical protein
MDSFALKPPKHFPPGSLFRRAPRAKIASLGHEVLKDLANTLSTLEPSRQKEFLSQFHSLKQERNDDFLLQSLFQIGVRLKFAGCENAALNFFTRLSQNDIPKEIRERAHQEAAAITGNESSWTMRTEYLLSGLAQGETTLKGILPMLGTTLVGQLVGTAVLGGLGRAAWTGWAGFLTKGVGRRLGAGLVSLAVETPVLLGLNQAVSPGHGSLGESWLPTVLSLGVFRAVGGVRQFIAARRPLAAGINELMHSPLPTFLGLYAVNKVEAKRMGIENGTTGTDTVFNLFHLLVGDRLGKSLFGLNRFQAELARWAEASRNTGEFGRRMATVTPSLVENLAGSVPNSAVRTQPFRPRDALTLVKIEGSPPGGSGGGKPPGPLLPPDFLAAWGPGTFDDALRSKMAAILEGEGTAQERYLSLLKLIEEEVSEITRLQIFPALGRTLVAGGQLELAEEVVDCIVGMTSYTENTDPTVVHDVESFYRELALAFARVGELEKAVSYIGFLFSPLRYETWMSFLTSPRDLSSSEDLSLPEDSNAPFFWLDSLPRLWEGIMPRHEIWLEQVIVKGLMFDDSELRGLSFLIPFTYEEITRAECELLKAEMETHGVRAALPSEEIVHILSLSEYRQIPQHFPTFFEQWEYGVFPRSSGEVVLRRRWPRELRNLAAGISMRFTSDDLLLSAEQAAKLEIVAAEEPALGDEPPNDLPTLLVYRPSRPQNPPAHGRGFDPNMGGLFGAKPGDA